MNLELNLDFKNTFAPEAFFFGVAYAPYLCEGGYNSDKGMKNNLAFLEMNGFWERSGEATRFWTTYEDHIQLAASHGLNAFRLGLEWTRVQPSTSMESHAPPPWDNTAVDHYTEIIATILKHGLQPIVTLHHFTYPAWVARNIWLSENGPAMLVDYEIKVVEEVNKRLLTKDLPIIRHFLVYNEPNVILSLALVRNITNKNPTGFSDLRLTADNMLSHYVKAYDGLYALFERNNWGHPHVGVTVANNYAYEMDKLFYDIVRIRSFGVRKTDVENKVAEYRSVWYNRMNELAKSKLTDLQFERYKEYVSTTQQALPVSALPKTIEAVYSSPRADKLDYISLNVYEPFGFVKDSPPWWEYAMDGEVYRTFIHAENDFNSGLPVYMGENTLAYKQPVGGKAEPRPDGWTRERYFKTYFMEIVRCIKEGVPIRGYLYWSLVDDYEWAAGYSPRLGLHNYDYINHRISEIDGLGEPAGRIYADLIATLRKGDKEAIARAFNLKWSGARGKSL